MKRNFKLVLLTNIVLSMFFSCNIENRNQMPVNLELKIDYSGIGSVDIFPEKPEYCSGDVVTLKASPGEYYEFAGWEGDIKGLKSELTTTLERSISAKAVFNLKPKYAGKWLILVHIGVDNNIDYEYELLFQYVSKYLETLESIEAGDLEGKLEIAVMIDGYGEPNNQNYISRFRDGFYHLSGGNIEDDLAVMKQEINSGSVEDSREFIDWALESFPAGHVYYSIFNHGGGFDDENKEGTFSIAAATDQEPPDLGIAFDDHSNDSLSHSEVNTLLKHIKQKTGRKVDIFHAFACLMGGVEFAYEIRNNADYLLCSEDVFPADDWSYEALGILNSGRCVSPVELGIEFCESAETFFTAKGGLGYTLALVDLSAADKLYNSINFFAGSLIRTIRESPESAYAFNTTSMVSYSMTYMSTGCFTYYYIDFGDYLKRIIELDEAPYGLRRAARWVLRNLEDAIVRFEEFRYPYATGLSIFHNVWNCYYSYEIKNYIQTLQFASNRWTDYLETMEAFAFSVDSDSYEPDNDYSEAEWYAADGTWHAHSLHDWTDVDIFRTGFETGKMYLIECRPVGTFGAMANIALYDDSLDNVGRSGYFDEFSDMSVAYYCEEGGDFFIKVRGRASGYYEISVKEVDVPVQDEYEDDNGFEKAVFIAADAPPQHHTFHNISGIDFDYLQTELEAGSEYSIRIFQASLPTATLVSVYDRQWETVPVYDEDLVGADSMLEFKCEKSGIYYIRICADPTHFGTGTRLGDYLIAVRDLN